jgi:hypothetical protein
MIIIKTVRDHFKHGYTPVLLVPAVQGQRQLLVPPIGHARQGRRGAI